jgi:hypothetical protein
MTMNDMLNWRFSQTVPAKLSCGGKPPAVTLANQGAGYV